MAHVTFVHYVIVFTFIQIILIHFFANREFYTFSDPKNPPIGGFFTSSVLHWGHFVFLIVLL